MPLTSWMNHIQLLQSFLDLLPIIFLPPMVSGFQWQEFSCPLHLSNQQPKPIFINFNKFQNSPQEQDFQNLGNQDFQQVFPCPIMDWLKYIKYIHIFQKYFISEFYCVFLQVFLLWKQLVHHYHSLDRPHLGCIDCKL